MGVCGGIAEYFDFSPTAVRVLMALLILVTSGLMLLVYIVMGFMMKPEPVYTGPGEGGPAAYPPGSRAEMLASLQARFDKLDKRLQRLESIVTRSDFGLEDEFRKL
ncbi:MAG: PspC domain-containing protein [bacterium]|nr:PspC domain-containing protein [bacterium]